MIKPLLTLVGKFAPGVNTLAWGYSIYQAGDYAVRIVAAIRGDSNVPIPVVNNKDLLSPASIVSTLGATTSAGMSVYSYWTGSGARLDKYKEELGQAMGDLREDITKVSRKEEKDIGNLEKSILTNKAHQTIQQIVMLYLDEYIRIFPRHEASFRNIKLLLATNENDYEGLVRVFEVLDNGPTNSLEHFMDVVLFDKVCKCIGEGDRVVDVMELMSSALSKRKGDLEKKIELYEDGFQNEGRKRNEEYMENFTDLTTNLTNVKMYLASDNYLGRKSKEELLVKLEKEYQEVWSNRPFKLDVPEGFKEQNDDYIECKEELRKIKEDLRLLRTNEIDYGSKNKTMYKEYNKLCDEVKDDEGYRRVFGNKAPKDVDLSKGKVSVEIANKIVRIKDIVEQNKYNMFLDKMFNGGDDGQVVLGNSISSPVKMIDHTNRYSALRVYNSQSSNEFIQKNKDILLNDPVSGEELRRRLDESARERRKEENELTNKLNASWKRIEDFDREHKRRESLGNKILGGFLAVVFSIGGMLLAWDLLKSYIFRPSMAPSFGPIWRSDKGFFTDMILLFKGYGRNMLIGMVMLMLLPNVVSIVIRLFFSLIRTWIGKISGSFMEGYKSIKDMFGEEGLNDEKDDKSVEVKENKEEKGAV